MFLKFNISLAELSTDANKLPAIKGKKETFYRLIPVANMDPTTSVNAPVP